MSAPYIPTRGWGISASRQATQGFSCFEQALRAHARPTPPPSAPILLANPPPAPEAPPIREASLLAPPVAPPVTEPPPVASPPAEPPPIKPPPAEPLQIKPPPAKPTPPATPALNPKPPVAPVFEKKELPAPAQKPPRAKGLFYYEDWWKFRPVQISVNGALVSGTPIFFFEDTLRVVNPTHSYFIPMEKIDFIRTGDGLGML